jgi:hypothetical protein
MEDVEGVIPGGVGDFSSFENIYKMSRFQEIFLFEWQFFLQLFQW